MKIDIGSRLLKLGGAVGCGLGAWICVFAAGMGQAPIMLVPAAGCAAGAVVLVKQAITGYREENR